MLSLNDGVALRRGEVAYIGAFHSIDGVDIDLALDYGRTLLSYTKEYSLKDPLKASSLLAEVALLAYWHSDEMLARDAGVRGLDLAVCISDDTVEQKGIVKEELNLIVAKNLVLGSILAGEDIEEDVHLMLVYLNKAIARYKSFLVENGDVLRSNHLGRLNELEILELFNRVPLLDKTYLDTSFLLDNPELVLFHMPGISDGYRIAVDGVGVDTESNGSDCVFLQMKRSRKPLSVWKKSGKKLDDYAPYICPVIKQGDSSAVVKAAEQHHLLYGKTYKYGLLATQPTKPLFLSYI